MVQAIVFLPLLAAIIAGLGGRWIGTTAAKAITTGPLFIGAALSWPIFIGFLTGANHEFVVPHPDHRVRTAVRGHHRRAG